MNDSKKSEDIRKKLPELQELLEDMVCELRFRGCDENHKLIKRAFALNEWFKNATP